MKQLICVLAAVLLTSLSSSAASAHHRWYGYGYGYGWGGPYYPPVAYYGGPSYWRGSGYWGAPAYWAPPVYYRPRWRRVLVYTYDSPYWDGGWGPRWSRWGDW